MSTPAQRKVPNQQTTWAALSPRVEEFSDWQQRTAGKYASKDTELLVYLSDQLGLEEERIKRSRFKHPVLNHPVLGLLDYMSASNNRMKELCYAYLAIAVAADSEPAKKLIAGQRLTPELHPDYVASTNCYGTLGEQA